MPNMTPFARLSSRLRRALPVLAALAVAFALAPAPAAAQGLFGPTAVGSASSVSIILVPVGTVASVSVVTQGFSGLDFTSANTAACVGTFAAGQSCTLNVTFKPTAVGIRQGAIVLRDASGNLLDQFLFQGIGQGAVAAFSGNAPVAYATTGQPTIVQLAMDAQGDIFYGNTAGGISERKANGDGTYAAANIVVASGLPTNNFLHAGGIDGAGNLYFGDNGHNVVYRLPMLNGAPAGAIQTIGGFSEHPQALASDGRGNVYVATCCSGNLYKIAPGATSATLIASFLPNLTDPEGMVADANGNLWLAGASESTNLLEILNPATAPSVSTHAVSAGRPWALGMDPNGDIYYSDGTAGSTNLYRVNNLAGSLDFSHAALVQGGVNNPREILFDAEGNMLVSSTGGGFTVYPQQYPPAQVFPQTNIGSTSASQSFSLTNLGNQQLAIASVGFDVNFPNQGSTCSTSLAPTASCTLTAAFHPSIAGSPVVGSLTITDNAANETGPQSASQSGTAPLQTQSISFTLASPVTFSGQTIVLGATASSGLPVAYALSSGAPAVLSGNSLIINGAGAFTVTASQAGNAAYSAATPVTQSLTVNPAPQSITFPALTTPVIVNSGQALAAVATSGLPLVYTVTAGTASISGANVTFTNAGTVTITASVAASGNYASAAPVSQTVQVNPEPVSYAAPATSVGQSASAQTAYVNFSIAGTLQAINVVTQGAANLDFTAAGGNCVVGQAYSAGQACEVDYSFSPKSAGIRQGGIVLRDASGNALGTSYITGLGNGPLGLFSSPVATLTANSNINVPRGISVDGNGDIFFANTGDNTLKEIPAGLTSVQTVLTTAIGTGATAVDGADNLYLASQQQNAIFQVVKGQLVLVASGVNPDDNLEVDGAGNLYTSDYNTGAIYKIDAGTHHVHTLLAGGQSHRFIGMRVDPAGNIFAADFNHNILFELPAAGPSLVTLASGAPLNQPHAVGLDPAGNVYVGNLNGTNMMRYAAGTWQETNLPANGTKSIDVDGMGNIYAAVNDTSISIYSRTTSPTITFPTAVYGSTASVPAAGVVEFENDGNADLNVSSYAASSNFGTAGTGNTCAAGILPSGATCFIATSIAPVSVGALIGTLTLTDNTLNQVNAQQVVNLAGAGTPAALTVTAANATMPYGSTPPAITGSASGLVNGDTLASLTGLTCSTNATAASNAGAYVTSCTGASDPNYTVSYVAGVFTVTKIQASITWAPASGIQAYGTNLASVLNASGTGTITYTNGAMPISAASVLPAGSYTLTATISGDQNHDSASTNYGLTVTPVAASVTASSGTMVYGTTPPTITGSASGLVNGDTLANLSSLTCSTTATATSDTGSYPSICSGAVTNNYSITYTAGSVTITKATSTVTWTPPAGSIVYGTPLAGVLDATGTGAVTYANGATGVTGATVLPAGTYTLAATSAGDINHTGSSAFVALTVTPAPLTVAADSFSRPYNTANPVFTGNVTGVQNGDTIAVSYSTVATQTSNVGTYAIVPALSGAALVNYTVTSVNGVFTIVPAAQAITFTPIGDQVFSGIPLTLTLNAAASSGLPVVFTVTGPATAAGNVLTINGPGLVTVTALQPGNGNYLAAAPAAQTFSAKLGLAYGFYATSSVCNSLSVQGKVRVDSFDSSLGIFPAGLQQSDGNVGTNGSLQLGGNASIYGALYDPHGNTRDGDCDRGHQASLITHGHDVQLTGGIVALPAPLTYPTPAAPSVAPPTSKQHLSSACGSVAGCTEITRGHLALAPGQYGNLDIAGNLTVDLSAGVYNINSLRLDGNAKLNVASGPVVIKLAGAGQRDDVFDAKGGTIQNSGRPGNLVILYAGQLDIDLGGNTGYANGHCDGDHDGDNCGPNAGISAVVDAPNADVKLSGNAVFSGTIIGSTIAVDGNVTVHYDRSLASTPAIGGGTPPLANAQGDHDGDGNNGN